MKKYLCVILGAACYFSIFSYAMVYPVHPSDLEIEIYESIYQELETKGKFYVSPGSIYVAPKGLFFHYRDLILPLTGISADSRGIYFEDYQFVRDSSEWLCKGCHYYNYYEWWGKCEMQKL